MFPSVRKERKRKKKSEHALKKQNKTQKWNKIPTMENAHQNNN